jgi:hypothetical protein
MPACWGGDPLPALTYRTQQDHAGGRQYWIGLDGPGQFQAVHTRHLIVQNRQVVRLALGMRSP